MERKHNVKLTKSKLFTMKLSDNENYRLLDIAQKSSQTKSSFIKEMIKDIFRTKNDSPEQKEMIKRFFDYIEKRAKIRPLSPATVFRIKDRFAKACEDKVPYDQLESEIDKEFESIQRKNFKSSKSRGKFRNF